jgi:hypothetical protein
MCRLARHEDVGFAAVGPVIHGVVALAGRPHDRATGHGTTLAPRRVAPPPAVVARAEAARTACQRRGDACAHPPHEPGEYPVGCTAHPGRTGEARRTGLTHHHCQVYGSTAWSAVADMAYLPAPSCRRFCCQWGLCGVRALSSRPVCSGDQGSPLVAGLLDDERSAAVCLAGRRIPHTAELYHVCVEHLGSRYRGPCPCPRTESTRLSAARPP